MLCFFGSFSCAEKGGRGVFFLEEEREVEFETSRSANGERVSPSALRERDSLPLFSLDG